LLFSLYLNQFTIIVKVTRLHEHKVKPKHIHSNSGLKS
jgi:hypothetical protein